MLHRAALNARRPAGFSLIEILVTISIIGAMLVMALPSVGNAISVSKTRTVVSKFAQDFTALRGIAAANTAAGGSVTLTFNADCSWSATNLAIPPANDPVHSLTSTALAAQASGVTCTGGPTTFTFTNQGFVTPSASVTFTASAGQSWPLTILNSGSVLLTNSAN